MTDRAQVARDVSDFIVPVCTTTSGKKNNHLNCVLQFLCEGLSASLVTDDEVLGGWGSFC